MNSYVKKGTTALTTVALGLILMSQPLLAREHTLIRPEDSPRVYWVDKFGIAHHVKNPKTLNMYFSAGEPILEIGRAEFEDMRVGGPVTIVTPPSLFDSTRNPGEVRLELGSGSKTLRISMDQLERLEELNSLEDLEDLEDISRGG